MLRWDKYAVSQKQVDLGFSWLLSLDLIIPYTLVLWFYSYFQIAFVHIYYEIKIINQDRSHKHIPTNKIQLENFLDNIKLWQNFKIFGQLIKLEYMQNAIAIGNCVKAFPTITWIKEYIKRHRVIECVSWCAVEKFYS